MADVSDVLNGAIEKEDSYMAKKRHLIMIDKWSEESGIVQKPTHVRTGEIKLHGVVHLEAREISDTKVNRNVGRQMVAGVIENMMTSPCNIRQ
jgi:hypothetical protein